MLQFKIWCSHWASWLPWINITQIRPFPAKNETSSLRLLAQQCWVNISGVYCQYQGVGNLGEGRGGIPQFCKMLLPGHWRCQSGLVLNNVGTDIVARRKRHVYMVKACLYQSQGRWGRVRPWGQPSLCSSSSSSFYQCSTAGREAPVGRQGGGGEDRALLRPTHRRKAHRR